MLLTSQKFLARAKKKYDSRIWVYGYYTEASACLTGPTIENEEDDYHVDRRTVGKYIGINDKNHKRIFEGDIVKTKYGRLCIVEWFHPCACFDLNPIGTRENLNFEPPDKYDMWASVNLEIIGNIYDNPDLLPD